MKKPWGLYKEEEEVLLGIDEHSLRHYDMLHAVTEVKKRKTIFAI